MKRLAFLAVTMLAPLAFGALALEAIVYRAIPPMALNVEGDPITDYDPVIGLVPYPNGKTRRTDLLPGISYNIFTDRRGARVSRPGDQVDRPEILFIGDSLTWGHGVDNGDTFAAIVSRELGAPVANLAMASMGTVHALQMLRRNLDLRPRLIVYGMTGVQITRNVTGCVPAAYPFCLDYSRVAWGDGGPYIAPPWSNGIRRYRMQYRQQREGLPPWEWVSHGVDLAHGMALLARSRAQMPDADRQEAALSFLMREMATAAKDAGAELLVVNLPYQGSPPPSKVLQAYRFVDLAPLDDPAFYIPKDGHYSVRGNEAVAAKLVAVLRHELAARR